MTTVPKVRARKGVEKLTMVTAYDFPTARIASEAGVDMIVVGDSVGEVVHGMDDIDIMMLHAQAVQRAGPRASRGRRHALAHLHVSPEETLRNAGRLVREGGCSREAQRRDPADPND